jgi:hypothetical protein
MRRAGPQAAEVPCVLCGTLKTAGEKSRARCAPSATGDRSLTIAEPGVAKWGTVSETSQGEGWWLANDGKWYPPQTAWGAEGETSQGEGWWLASDGKWYPPQTALPQQATAEASSLAAQESENISQQASQETAPPEQASPQGSVTSRKPLLQRLVFWVSVAAVIILAAVIGIVTTSTNDTTGKHVAAPTTTVSPGPARASGGSSKTGGSESAKANGSTNHSGNTTTAAQLAVGGTESFSVNGAPVYGLTVTQFVDPAQPAQRSVTPKTSGDIFVAVSLTFKNTGVGEVSQDIYNDATLYDSTGHGYQGNFEPTASGPGFPVGIVSDAGGATTSGWIMFEVPASSTGFSLTFTPTEGAENQTSTTWKLS